MSKPARRVFVFDQYRLDPDERLLYCNGAVLPVAPKAFDILLILVTHSGRLVLKDDLMQAVWPDTCVEEGNLAQNIFVLRKLFGETAQESRYIATVPGR